MSEGESCPSCEARPMIRKRKLTISRFKKFKKDLGALCCCRLYCPVGMYRIVFKCPSCGWKGELDGCH